MAKNGEEMRAFNSKGVAIYPIQAMTTHARAPNNTDNAHATIKRDHGQARPAIQPDGDLRDAMMLTRQAQRIANGSK